MAMKWCHCAPQRTGSIVRPGRKAVNDILAELTKMAAIIKTLHTSTENLSASIDCAKAAVVDSSKWAGQARQITSSFPGLSQKITDIAAAIEAIGRQSK